MAAPRRLVLLRHGRTAWNLERRVQGHVDVPLDGLGRSQASRVAPVLAAMDPVFIRSSDLARARETAEMIAEAAGLTVQTDRRFREFDMGELSGRTMGEYAEENPDDHALLAAGDYDRVPGGETVPELTARFVPALEDAFDALPPGGLGIVVSHGSASRVSAVAWLGLPPEAAATFRPLGNCHWGVLEVGPGSPDRPGAAVRRLVAYNAGADPDFATRRTIG